MKRYEAPELDVISVLADDVISTSEGVETPKVDGDDPIWDLNH